MKIEVLAQSKARKELITNVAQFFRKQLKLESSTYKVLICSTPNLLKEENVNGLCGKTGEREITIAVDSRLPYTKLFLALAHEMTHAKQFAKGQYRTEVSRRGKQTHYWMGKAVNKDYLDRPWEIEAFGTEALLVHRLSEHVAQKMLKDKKKA
jgi:hypothetical protein